MFKDTSHIMIVVTGYSEAVKTREKRSSLIIADVTVYKVTFIAQKLQTIMNYVCIMCCFSENKVWFQLNVK
jgi:hypothetical protein